MSRQRRVKNQIEAPRVPVAEQLLIDELPHVSETRILCTSLGRGQFAAEAARQAPGACVMCHFWDVYLAHEARQAISDSGLQIADWNGADCGDRDLCGVAVTCAADLPAAEFDLGAIPVDPRGEGELTRDVLQSIHEQLRIGGRLLATVSNPDDQWLHGELRKLFSKVTRRPTEQGVLYLATKNEALRKLKEFACEFAVRDRDRLIKVVSRPGVFSHRSLDAGARALINLMEVGSGDRVLDLGCGSGAVGFAAALRAENVEVVAVDSNARAAQCTIRGAALNHLENVTVLLNAEGDTGVPETFDLVLGNPPYYSDYQIAAIFLNAARQALKPGGRVLMVTKTPAWFEEQMPALFTGVQTIPHKAYFVVLGMLRPRA
ncbi:MAG: class I SAM-dependent methyltransferase [Planctomycetaceae bacterium]